MLRAKITAQVFDFLLRIDTDDLAGKGSRVARKIDLRRMALLTCQIQIDVEADDGNQGFRAPIMNHNC